MAAGKQIVGDQNLTSAMTLYMVLAYMGPSFIQDWKCTINWSLNIASNFSTESLSNEYQCLNPN
jgi:hypothetical protein